MKIRKYLVAGITVALGLSLAACSTGSADTDAAGGADDGAAKTVEVTPEIEKIRALVPESLTQQGFLNVGYQNTAGLPYGEIDENGKDRGLSVDLANELGAIFGLEVRGSGVDFATLIPGLEAGRYDLVTNITTDKPERRAVVDYVDVMFGEPSSLVVQSDSKLKGTELADACGLTIGVDTGSSQEEQVQQQSDACVAKGDEKITVQAFQGIPDMLLSLKSGRSDAIFLSMGASRYTASQDDSLALSKTSSQLVELNGILTPKGNGMQAAVRAAMLHLVETGEWEQLLAKYGLEDLAPTVDVVNNDNADYSALLAAAQAERG